MSSHSAFTFRAPVPFKQLNQRRSREGSSGSRARHKLTNIGSPLFNDRFHNLLVFATTRSSEKTPEREYLFVARATCETTG